MKEKFLIILKYFTQPVPLIGLVYLVLGLRGLIFLLPKYSGINQFANLTIVIIFMATGVGLIRKNDWPFYLLVFFEIIMLLGTLVLFTNKQPISGPLIVILIQAVVLSVLHYSKTNVNKRLTHS